MIKNKFDEETYYRPNEVILLSTDTLARHRMTGEGIPFTRAGRKIFYKGADIIAYLESNRVETVGSHK